MARAGRKALGDLGEAAASAWLATHGYEVLERNVRTRRGEIDLVARHEDVLVFVEVKSRTGAGFGHPAEAVAAPKQRRLARLALAYLQAHGLDACPMRFDVIAVLVTPEGKIMRIDHLRDAFQVRM